MNKKLLKISMVSTILILSSTLMSCNLKVLARPDIEKQNEESFKNSNELMELQDKANEKLLASGLEGNWKSDDESLIIFKIEKISETEMKIVNTEYNIDTIIKSE